MWYGQRTLAGAQTEPGGASDTAARKPLGGDQPRSNQEPSHWQGRGDRRSKCSHQTYSTARKVQDPATGREHSMQGTGSTRWNQGGPGQGEGRRGRGGHRRPDGKRRLVKGQGDRTGGTSGDEGESKCWHDAAAHQGAQRGRRCVHMARMRGPQGPAKPQAATQQAQGQVPREAVPEPTMTRYKRSSH
ncbi:hypothetical protein WJX82_007320 [Trebouxia sp. C0006]